MGELIATSAPGEVRPAAESKSPTVRARSSRALGFYQPGLDGMRGLAMLWMLGYHGELAYTRGAFLALSQFFTLSGFLIMGVLLRNHLVPGAGLRSFWTRRFRRLMPAAFLALAGIVLFGATVATRQQAQALPGDVLSAATWTANWHFILSGTSYVNLFAAPSPVQHFWSLAIEEQFYLVLPIALALLVRKTRSLAVIGAVLVGAALFSTAWMIFLYHNGASLDRLYYGTDTRMAELVAGAVLAVAITHWGVDWSERVRWLFAGAGLVAFAATIWCWSFVSLADGPIWQGGFLLFALISCTVILGVLSRRGPLGPILSWGPLPWVGRLSYGLYLFHWPVYLWLTADRTGLDGWALLALRLAVTFSLAVLSYRYVEQPILHGRSLGLRGPTRWAIIPITIVVVVVAAFVTVNRSAEDPLAALRASAASVTMPTDGDRVLDVLVIPPRDGDPVVERLRKDAAADRSIKLTVAPPFACAGGLVATSTGRTCASWAASWPDLVQRTNPDAVLFFADDWAGDDLAALTGPTVADQTAGAKEILGSGVSMLAARGAPIVWARSGTNIAEAIRRSTSPFSQAMAQLRSQRDDLFEIIGTRIPDPATVTREEYVDQASGAMLSDLALYRRTTGSDLPRVMIVGDSQSLTLGYGLERWASVNRRAVVWNHGIEGCGLAVAGQVRTFGAAGTDLARCRDAVKAWPDQLRAFRPDAVVVLTSLADVQDRKFGTSSSFESLGDADFDARLVSQYRHAIDTLSSTGARVVWMDPPCTATKSELGQKAAYDAKDMRYLDTTIIPKAVRGRAGKVVRFDLARLICPGNEPLTEVGGRELRPDGLHFSVDGALWFADKHGDALFAGAGIDRAPGSP